MKSLLIFMFFFLTLFTINAHAVQGAYLIAEIPVAVFNTPAAAEAKKTLKRDACGQARALEFIAQEGTVFEVKRRMGNGKNPVFEVSTTRYMAPQGIRLYLSSHGVRALTEKPDVATPAMPEFRTVLKNLRSATGSPYVWGGNVRKGIKLPDEDNAYAGLDCSGLLYEATNGYTPRNTSELVNFGKPVPVAGLGREQIIARLKPLDLIVWNGHVIIVLDSHEVVESTLWCGRPGNGGVITMPLRQRLGEIMTRRKGVDNWPEGGGKPLLFVVRRWAEP